jgi:SAM-dependent methyltransferase
MTHEPAATWIAPADETDRGNLLGAAIVAAQREAKELTVIVDGADQADAAIAAAHETGLLILPESGQVLPDAAHELALLQRARAEGWRLLLLPRGADSGVTHGSAATWIAPTDETDRDNLLAAAIVAAQREGKELTVIVEGADEADTALAFARETGLLILSESDQVLPDSADELALLQRGRAEGWRLLLLSLGADSTAQSGDLTERLLARLAATPGPAEPRPVPPAALRHRVAAGTEATFFRWGLLHVECFEACLAQAGVSLADNADLLEWGAGCGRMTIHLTAKAPNARVTAADTDAEAIAWIAEELPVHAAHPLPLLPPTPFAPDAFDLVIGHSVFSHLDVDAQDRWLEELARVTRPGGHIAVSFNGPVALRWHLEHPLVDVPASVEADVARDGVAVWRGDGWEAEFYDGYHTTFHSHDYVRERWSRWVEVVDIHEAAALPTQDVAVLRPR